MDTIESKLKTTLVRKGRRAALFLSVVVLIAACDAARAAAAADVSLWRLDCGQIRVDDLNDFSDTFAYPGRSMRLVVSCYLIRHGDTYMLWDTGLPESALGQSLDGKDAKEETLSVTVVDQLRRIGVDPARVSIGGISHYHYDHTGQAARSARAKPLTHWLDGGGKLQEVVGDRDVFEDASVIMLDLPGHTPGHHGLLVKLPHTGAVILSGDAAHFRENYDSDGLPAWNTDRAQTVASLHRIKQIVKNLGAILVIQHDPDDVKRLPAFPEPAR